MLLATASYADPCPPPPSSIDPSVTASISFDKKAGLYTYKYAVQNGQSSQIPIDTFIVQLSQSPTEIQSPVHWISGFMNLSHMPFHIIWDSVYSSKRKSVDIGPGQRLSGFSFKSAQPPGVVQYNAQGRTGVPSSSPPAVGAADDEPTPNCPNWDFNNPRFQTLVTGLTTGPLNPNTVSVAIRLRDEKGEHPSGPINPSSPVGKISVLILGSKSFDPSQILVSSIKFGPSSVSPLSPKLVSRRDEDDRGDDREEWEKQADSIDGDRDDKGHKKQNLLLIFDQASLGVQCVLDKALFLSGKTQAGENIVAGATTRLFGCDVKHPGVRAPGKHHAGHDGGD